MSETAFADTPESTVPDVSTPGDAGQRALPRKPHDIAASLGVSYDSNVSRARDSIDKLSDESLKGEIAKTFFVPLGNSFRLMLDVYGGAEGFRTYTKLSSVYAGLYGQVQYRPSIAFYAPVVSVFSLFEGNQYGSDLRRGYRYSVGGTIDQPVTDRIRVSGTLAHNQRYAKSDVFAAVDNAAQLSVNYRTLAGGRFYANAEYRLGDAVSSGRLTLENIDVANVFVRDDAFNRNDFFSYRFRAHMWFTSLGYVHPIGRNGSLDASWRYAHVTPTERPDFEGASNVPYVSSQFIITYKHRF
ncbi:hypothetical protein [Paraburkholderia caledonica]|uniref:DUF3570 domain-containing protein n=1 Tax=Paraburkholderia caledonica TaxID=134536 RepID=A0ABU1KYN1_9BURK|nr:hypothetical protein [Paraburkholderia caledonica]MDR6376088.1 hypothetical protein [Paraburkholderia caledonica]